MKKTKITAKILSVILAASMLLALCAMILPASAVESGKPESNTHPAPSKIPADGYDPYKAWSDKQKYPATASYDNSWTAIKTEAEFTAMQGGQKYYLANDITIQGTKTFAKLTDLTLDGNGHTVTLKQNVGLFKELANPTFTNIKFVFSNTVTTAIDGGVTYALLAGAVSAPASFTNTVVQGNITVSGTQYPSVGGIVASSTGASFKMTDVVYSGNITLNNITTGYGQGDLGGILGRAGSSVTMTNCIANGKMTVNGASWVAAGFIGYLATGQYEFDGCINNMDITVSGDNAYVSGLFGLIQAPATHKIKNCINTGTLSAPFTTKTVYQADESIGSIIASIQNGTVTLENCTNYGSINQGNAKYLGGLVGRTSASLTVDGCVNEGAISISSSCESLGGIVGDALAGITVKNCLNNGSISGTQASANNNYVGGILGISWNTLELSDCQNTGAITMASGAGHTQAGVGGIVGLTCGVSSITVCENKGNITANGKNNAGGILGSAYGGCTTTIDKCVNSGTITDNADIHGCGGICGYSNGALTLKSCVNVGTVTGAVVWGLGGVMGYSESAITIEKCVNGGNITGKPYYGMGGIMGTARNGVSIKDCVNIGAVTNSLEQSAGYAKAASGILGQIWRTEATDDIKLENCVNAGDITVTAVAARSADYWVNAAGMIARLDTPKAQINNCTNLGKIKTGSTDGYGSFPMVNINAGEFWSGAISDVGQVTGDGNKYLEGTVTEATDKIKVSTSASVDQLEDAFEVMYGAYEFGTSQHWTNCEDSDITGTKTNHSFVNEYKFERFLQHGATCGSGKVYYKSCICGAVGTETFDDGSAHDGNSHWWGNWNNSADRHIGSCQMGCGATIDAAHEGGTATCIEKKVCTVCKDAYGELDSANHSSEETKTVSNGDGTHKSIHACCEAAAGDNEKCAGGTATCKAKAVCSTCNGEYGEINAAGHQGGTANCKTKAICALCEKEYGELDAKNHTTRETKFGAQNDGKHGEVFVCCGAAADNGEKCSGGKIVCGSKLVCHVCKAEYGKVIDHNFGDFGINAEKHWKVCGDCGKTGEEGAHEYVDGVCLCGRIATAEELDPDKTEPDDGADEPQDPTGGETDGAETDGAETDGAETDGAETDGIETGSDTQTVPPAKNDGGCGSVLAGAAAVVCAVSVVGCAVVFKKKED